MSISNRQNITFQEAIEIIESLPEYQQEDLIHIIRHRLTEQRREQLASNIKEARAEYARGEIKKGTVDDLMKEFSP
ncbi:conserved hypothetical protein [Candidatus Brocadia pituitae]|nr:conserved hypothetical protein [Candidatus Brocadia pituitae]